MGVLDDAIRQHLDLKRQHGADESELQRKENEALGPARRESTVPAADDEVGADAPTGEAPVEEAPLEPESLPPEEPAVDDGPFGAEEPFADPAPVEPPVDETPLPPVDDEPIAYDDEPLPAEPAPPAAAPAADDDDVLEETPDFLQETPEHDRLWFEQKPPRDFDFDDDDR